MLLEVVLLHFRSYLKLRMKSPYPVMTVSDDITMDQAMRHVLEEVDAIELQRINQKTFPLVRDMFKQEKGIWFNVQQRVEAIHV